jgi:hypothetical protein
MILVVLEDGAIKLPKQRVNITFLAESTLEFLVLGDDVCCHSML